MASFLEGRTKASGPSLDDPDTISIFDFLNEVGCCFRLTRGPPLLRKRAEASFFYWRSLLIKGGLRRCPSNPSFIHYYELRQRLLADKPEQITKWLHPNRDGGRTGHVSNNDLGRRGGNSGRMSLSRQTRRDLGPGVQCVSQLGSGPGVGLFGVLALLIHDDILAHCQSAGSWTAVAVDLPI